MEERRNRIHAGALEVHHRVLWMIPDPLEGPFARQSPVIAELKGIRDLGLELLNQVMMWVGCQRLVPSHTSTSTSKAFRYCELRHRTCWQDFGESQKKSGSEGQVMPLDRKLPHSPIIVSKLITEDI